MKDIVLKYVLQNSVKYNGKPNPNAVIGKILQENQDLRKDIPNLQKEVAKTIKEISSWSLEKQENELKNFKFKKIIKKEKKFSLNNPKNIVMRFAPNPNGPPSIGHCRQAVWNWFFVKKHKGKFILRFDDTDPKIKPPLKQAYKLYKKDLAWLGIKPHKTVIQSSRFNTYYKYAEELVKKNHAYVCTCKPEQFRKLIHQKQACPCRNLKDQEKRYKKLFTKYKEGEAVLRIKTDLEHPNPAVRDWPALRIVDKPKHPLKKAKVWPLLNFASAIDDHLLKVTHILRGIDLQASRDRQQYIYKYFKWTYPETIYTGKLIFFGMKSTSEIKKLIDQKKITGWDDIRLGTIMSLRKRGFKPEAITKFLLELGINRNEVKVSVEKLNSYNKDLIDKGTNRYFAVFNSKKIKIEKSPNIKVKAPLHPDFPKKDSRLINTKDEFYIQDDLVRGKMYRFMHLFNFKDKKFVSKNYDANLNATLIHWLPIDKNLVNVEVVLPDNSKIKGLAENNIKKLKLNETIQFERNFFCTLIKKDKNKYLFYYLHK
ncbi:glutamate--tRNA ligase [archaeon]|nr:glutamate--tRNA ligase [archaeon]